MLAWEHFCRPTLPIASEATDENPATHHARELKKLGKIIERDDAVGDSKIHSASVTTDANAVARLAMLRCRLEARMDAAVDDEHRP